MYKQVLLIILYVHGMFSILYAVFILSGKSHLRKEFIIPILLAPVFGVISAIAIDFLHVIGKQGGESIDLHSFALNEDIYWKNIKSRQEDDDIVPLEEAISINDEKTRRKLMLETLYDDPLKYLDVLMIARSNEDIETAHYATTTISKVQRNFQMEIQKYAVAVEKNPDDIVLLDKYLNVLEKFIESGVLEDYLLKRQRIIYSKALNQKLAKQENDRKTLIKKLQNCIQLEEYGTAFEVSDILKNNWPADEKTWIESIRVCVEGQDKKRLQETIKKIRHTRIDWTKQGKEQVYPWMKA